MRNRRIAVVACVGVFCALIVRSAPAAALPGERQLLAVPSIGTHPPGGGDLTSISKFTLGPSGSLVVSANWRVPSGGGVLNGGGAWLLDGGVLTEVAREDGEVSGFPGYVYSFLSSVGSGKSGEALVSAELFSVLSAPRTVGLWRVRSGQSELLLQMDAAAPGLSDGSLLGGGNASNSAFDFGAIDRFGRTVVKTAIHGPAVDPNVNGSIAYWFDGSSFQKILRTGDLVDGVSSPVTSMSARFTSREGRSVFSVSTGVSSQSRHVFEFDGAALAPVIIDRTAAPGLGGLLFVSPSAQAMSPGGTIAIYSGLTGPSAQNSAIWRRVDGVISLAARESQTIASPAGWTMRAIDNGGIAVLNPIAINDPGDCVFLTAAGPGSDQKRALCLADAGGVRVLFRDQDPRPGGGQFLLTGASATPIAEINRVGCVAFSLDDAVFSYIPGVGLERIAGPGDTFEVLPGLFQTILFAKLGNSIGSNSINATGLLDNGDLYYLVGFTGGSAIFRTTVPAPGVLLAAGAAASLLTIRRRRV